MPGFYFEDRGDEITLRSYRPVGALGKTGAIVQRWKNCTEAVADAHFELTIEEFAPLLATFRQMEAAGITFDPMLTALIKALERQAYWSDSDIDADAGCSDEIGGNLGGWNGGDDDPERRD